MARSDGGGGSPGFDEVAYGAGGQRAVLVRRAQASVRGLIVGTEDPELPGRFGFEGARTLEAAVAGLFGAIGERARVLVVPNALGGIPVPAETISSGDPSGTG
jgi:hypothetical protein